MSALAEKLFERKHNEGPGEVITDDEPVSTKAKKRKGKKPNPYLDGRREWNAQFGRQVSEKNTWRLVALLALLISLVSIGGLVTLGASTKVVPYVAVIDELGNPLAQGMASTTGATDPRVIRAVVGDFFKNFRSVTTDGYAQKERIRRVYAMLSAQDPSYRVLNEHYSKALWDPFERAKKVTVSVDLLLILPLSKHSYRVEWREVERDRTGQVMNTEKYQANLTLKQSEELSGQEMLENPLGLYVTEIHWSKRL